MKTQKLKRMMSLFLAALICVTTLVGFGTTAYAAEETDEVCLVSFPRDGDANYGGEWGHGSFNFMNGWFAQTSRYTTVRAMGSYDGNICYCIEPGVPQESGDRYTKKGENFWDNYPSSYNHTISPDDIKLFIGRIFQYGYTGTISTSWRSQNEGGDKLAHAVATQLLVWETIVGERDADFNKVGTGGKDAICDQVSTGHPLYSQIMSYYNSIAASVQTHSKVPSFFAKSTGKAKNIELEWDGEKYTATLTDTNNVLSNYTFSASVSGIRFSVNGKKLVITADTAPSDTVRITAEKKNSQRRGVITWTDGVYGPNGKLQDIVTYAQSVNDPVKGYLNIKVSYGSGYSLVEIFAPYGYTLNSDPMYFDVVQDASTDEGGVAVIEVVKPNMAQKGVIRISKSGEVFSSVIEADGLYQPVFSVRGLPGAVYEITAAEDIITPDGTLRTSAGEVVDTVTTDETGFAESKPLYLGKYEIREITAPYGMILNPEIRTAELVYAGQEIEITETSAGFYNERQKAAVSLDKILEQNKQFGIGANGEMSAVTFGLFAAEDLTAADGSVIPADGLLEILSVDENGHADCKTDLPLGSFYLKELSTDEHYILSDEKYTIVFEYAGQETALVEIKANDGKPIGNDLIYGEIHGLKKNEDGNALGGAVIGLFKPDTEEFTTDTAILTATSAEDGSFSFANVPYGNWIVREIEAPTGFVLSEGAFAVTVNEDGAVIEIEIKNTLIRGTVQITKVDKDYPDNKLTGAEFFVYRDSNGNKALDADDELLGTLTETSVGVYEMSDLVYGGYFVKEQKAPEGFYLDENAYYFEITENGKTVTVENEAGKGFVNTAKVGSLKIIKTSSDGKIEGFSFRVTGPNGYSEVFTTDKNGEILIENLRIGDYTVSEVSDGASVAYILPADKTASVFEGAVTKVEMHNELRDTPKTGDDSNPALWKWLTAIGMLGFAACGGGYIAYAMKKKKEDAE